MLKRHKFILFGLVVALTLCLSLAIPAQAATNRFEMPGSGWDPLGGPNSTAVWSRLGQRLTLNNTEIIGIGFRICKVGNATGDIIMSIRDSVSNKVLASAVWGDASELPVQGTNGYREVTFDTLVQVSGDVRFCVEYYGGTSTSHCEVAYYSGDRIAGQWYTNYLNYYTDAGGWHDIGEAEECCYCYTYVAEDGPAPDGDDGTDSGSGIPLPLWVVIIAVPVTAALGVWYMRAKKGQHG
jgi:hypothetical protein